MNDKSQAQLEAIKILRDALAKLAKLVITDAESDIIEKAQRETAEFEDGC